MMKKWKLCAAALLIAASGAAHAQSWPSRPIKVVVPAGPGGAADVLARALGDQMGPAMGTSFVIENRGGAGGIIGTDAVAKAPADGYTVLLSSNTFVIAPSLYKVPFDIHRDFAPVGMVASAPNLLVANAELGVRTVADLVAKAKATPGGLSYGSPAVGSAAHLTVELLGRKTGMPLAHVPFKGPQQAMTETLAGRVPITIAGVSNALPHLKSGKLVALAVTGAKRSPLVPDVPTFAEAGVAGVDVTLWFAMLAPAGTPPDVLARLNTELNAALASPAVAERLGKLGFDPLPGPPAALADTIRREEPVYAGIVKEAGIKVE